MGCETISRTHSVLMVSLFSEVSMCHTPSYAIGVKPGTISDPNRIWSPPPPGEAFHRVEAMALPANSEVKEVFDEMVNGSGVPYRRLMSVIGGCQVCDQVMTLPNILTHVCLGRVKEKGPSPPERPLLLERRRALPTVVSRMKGSSSQQSGILANDGDIAFADVPIGTLPLLWCLESASDFYIGGPTRKRKLNHSFSPQRMFVPATKKSLDASEGNRSLPPTSTLRAKAETSIDFVSPLARLRTAESWREVPRDRNMDFMMYEKA